jgi:hypothetical protein
MSSKTKASPALRPTKMYRDSRRRFLENMIAAGTVPAIASYAAFPKLAYANQNSYYVAMTSSAPLGYLFVQKGGAKSGLVTLNVASGSQLLFTNANKVQDLATELQNRFSAALAAFQYNGFTENLPTLTTTPTGSSSSPTAESTVSQYWQAGMITPTILYDPMPQAMGVPGGSGYQGMAATLIAGGQNLFNKIMQEINIAMQQEMEFQIGYANWVASVAAAITNWIPAGGSPGWVNGYDLPGGGDPAGAWVSGSDLAAAGVADSVQIVVGGQSQYAGQYGLGSGSGQATISTTAPSSALPADPPVVVTTPTPTSPGGLPVTIDCAQVSPPYTNAGFAPVQDGIGSIQLVQYC